jgi:hypothetical protein
MFSLEIDALCTEHWSCLPFHLVAFHSILLSSILVLVACDFITYISCC